VTRSPATVVICAYTLDRWALLTASIESVLNQPVAPSNLVVVVDHHPELRARLTEAYPGLQIVENSRSRGLSGARNSGVAVGDTDVVAFLDDDAAAVPDWLDELVRGFSDPTIQGTGGAILPVWASGRPRWFPQEFDWVVGCTYRGHPTVDSSIRNPIGANMAFRRATLEAVGGFREGLGRIGNTPVGGEETELAIRVVRLDRSARFEYRPRAIVHHNVPRTRATWRYYLHRCYAEGLSKAMITRIVGGRSGLASERGYATRTLPVGIARGFRDVARGDLWGIARAFAIVAGLLVTTTGYLVGLARSSSASRSAPLGAAEAGR
jgi:cellulose synthase/poly-beta-1,6-N-acetylglucosamine synthase-like glycosyltransferase